MWMKYRFKKLYLRVCVEMQLVWCYSYLCTGTFVVRVGVKVIIITRNFIIAIAIAMGLTTFIGREVGWTPGPDTALAPPDQRPPNIVLILADGELRAG